MYKWEVYRSADHIGLTAKCSSTWPVHFPWPCYMKKKRWLGRLASESASSTPVHHSLLVVWQYFRLIFIIFFDNTLYQGNDVKSW